ncbi:hypothetical protein M9Y10_033340 [Tritrichomonas musculus]|uniref:Doublecortin domain-containing protein n=1 Tax=Tritrichomonas musculus TaxID=1915356 RepID=A0ABR2KBV1_9EUKA
MSVAQSNKSDIEENNASQANIDQSLQKAPEISTQNSQSPRSILKKTPTNKSVKGKNVYLVKNAYPRNDKPKLYRLVTFENLLKDSVDILFLPSLAKRVFTEDGKAVTSIDEISEKQTLYISCGEKFGLGSPSPKKRPTLKESDQNSKSILNPSYNGDNQSNQSPAKQKTPAPSFASSPSKYSVQQSPKKSKKENELDSFQKTLFLSSFSPEMLMRESAASVYSSMTEEQKKKLIKHDYIEALHDEIQQTEFLIHLIDTPICPTIPVSPINEELNHMAIEILNGMEVDELKFVIDGPRQSGKTTFLFIMAKQISRKLQLSDQSGKFLFFPLNFEYITHELTNPKNLLKIFLTTILNGLKYSDFKFLPHLPSIKQFFNNIVNTNVPQLPSSLINVDIIDSNKLIEIGRKISNALHKNEVDSLKNYVKLLVSLPQEFASLFGFVAPFYIFDSFDYCDLIINPGPEYFTNSIHSVSFAPILSSELNNGHYIVSLQDEERFFECFASQDAALLDIEYAIKENPDLPDISIFKPKLHFTISDCHGYPGYITHYAKLVDSIRKFGENSSRKSNYATIQTSADVSRMFQIKRDLKTLYNDFLQIEKTSKKKDKSSKAHFTETTLTSLDDEFIIIHDFLSVPRNEEEED